MPESIPQLEQLLRTKKHELDSLNDAITGAGVGALLTKGSPIGVAIGAVMTNDKAKKDQLEREIADINTQIQEVHAHISQLDTKRSQLMNTFQNEKATFEASTRQAYNTLENRKLSTQDPQEIRTFDDQLSRLRSDTTAKEVQYEQDHQQQLDAIQQEINRLSL